MNPRRPDDLGKRKNVPRPAPRQPAENPSAAAGRLLRGASGELLFAALLDGLTEQKLDLAVHAAQLVASPRLELGPELGVDAKEKGFAVFGGHQSQQESPVRLRTVSMNQEGWSGEMTTQRSGQRRMTARSPSVT